MTVEPYLNFCGNCEQAMRFYEEHLGGKITFMMRQGEQPGGEVMPGLEGKILYSRMEIDGNVVMASDGPPGGEPMRSAYLCLRVESVEKAEWYNGLLGDQGETFMPMQETFFAHRFSMLRDRFGTLWMIINERHM